MGYICDAKLSALLMPSLFCLVMRSDLISDMLCSVVLISSCFQPGVL